MYLPLDEILDEQDHVTLWAGERGIYLPTPEGEEEQQDS